MEKNTLLLPRSTMRKKDSKGRDVIVLYFNPETIPVLIAELQSAAKGPKGAKFTVHTEKKTHEGRSFDSSFAFIAAVQDKSAGVAPVTYVPKAAGVAASLRAAQVKV